ncbi:hypothetical protein Tco_1009314 [Tanacetum coccineum]
MLEDLGPKKQGGTMGLEVILFIGHFVPFIVKVLPVALVKGITPVEDNKVLLVVYNAICNLDHNNYKSYTTLPIHPSNDSKYPWKRISDKRTKNEAKNYKIGHGMEKRGKAKVNPDT